MFVVVLVLWIGGFPGVGRLWLMLVWVGWWSVLHGFCGVGAGLRFPARCLFALVVGLYGFVGVRNA